MLFCNRAYSLLRISKEIDALIDHYHFNTVDSYWDDERNYVDEKYRNIPFPVRKIKTPAFAIECEWTSQELEGYLNTWSGLQKFIMANHYNPVNDLMQRIKTLWSQEKMKISFPVHLLMTRIEK